MTPLTSVLLAALVAAVAVFVVSSIIHMALPIHKSDMKGLPQEDAVLEALRKAGVSAGEYMFPWCSSMQEMGSEAMKQKWERGPTGTVIVRPAGGLAMGRSLGQWFVLCLVTSFFVAYALSLVLAPGAQNVFRVASSVAFLGYGFGSASNSVWKSVPWSTTFKFCFDALLYALATGAAFAWMWPAA
jgi:hypothetical protein